ncbi:uncharacterized protein B0T15DRAFT_526803 [Chaetomium strumarium]|uniref:Secreted protein n=1 Tax=Chaetomium strumarium TaxID=1170767 RepID=A0AAJ0GUE7_9PEZI|nr:hypothetical protein B0T15DRAFT_526803 [Chaetomium strumarium]
MLLCILLASDSCFPSLASASCTLVSLKLPRYVTAWALLCHHSVACMCALNLLFRPCFLFLFSVFQCLYPVSCSLCPCLILVGYPETFP